jgi:putative glutamine amidotransferase
MAAPLPSLRIGIYGCDDPHDPQLSRGCNLWAVGYRAAVTEAGGSPQELRLPSGCSWDEVLDEVDGVVLTGNVVRTASQQAQEERLCEWSRELGIPVLAIDRGLHVLNGAFGGTIHQDLARELPNALQHRHPPEPGVRHAITVEPGTWLANIYGEGEIIVNSEHRQAVCRVARGFRVSARALDGVIEAIEAEAENWFAVGVQWHPASASASGLDIQLFRGFTDACRARLVAAAPVGQLVAA